MRGPHLLLAVAVIGASALQAQTDLSVFSTTGRAAATTFVTDYQAIGINPANLGWAGRWPKKKVFFGFAECSVSANSEALTRDDLRASVLGKAGSFTQEQKLDAARTMAGKGFTLNADIMSFGAAFRTDAFGGIGFQVRDRAHWSSTLGPLATDLLFLGSTSSYFDRVVLANGDTIPNTGNFSQATIDQIVQGIRDGNLLTLSTLLKGTRISFNWYREYNVSYGRRIFHGEDVELYAGIGLKYLSGYGIIDISADGEGTLGAFSALSPLFDVDYGSVAGATNTVRKSSGGLPQAVGNGSGMDLGLSALIAGKWKFGVAVTNLGSINWKGNAFSANDGYLADLASSGLDSYNMIDGINDFTSKNSVLDWSGERSRKVPLPANLRLGTGVLLGEVAEIGVDVVVPLNDQPGNFDKAFVGFGGDIRPTQWLQFSLGLMTGGGFSTRLPAGITFNVAKGTFEFGVASRDVITFFASHDPTISLCVGFLRFRI